MKDIKNLVTLSVLIALVFAGGAIAGGMACAFLIALPVELFGGSFDLDAPFMLVIYAFAGLLQVAHAIQNGSFAKVMAE